MHAHLAGEPIRSVAARYGDGVSSVPKWVTRWRTTGSVAPDRIGGHRSWLLEPHRELVPRPVGETLHLTIDRLQDLLAAEGIAVCRDTIWRFLGREGLRCNWTLFALEQTRAALARKRARWQALMRRLEADRLVFVDGIARPSRRLPRSRGPRAGRSATSCLRRNGRAAARGQAPARR